MVGLENQAVRMFKVNGELPGTVSAKLMQP